MRTKTSELTGLALDWAVAKCEVGRDDGWDDSFISIRKEDGQYNYSTDWAQGGPIIEWERITIQFDGDGIHADLTTTVGKFYQGFDEYKPLIAAMRVYVASKLGDEVEVPDVLAQP
jgi:hypothetical protein